MDDVLKKIYDYSLEEIMGDRFGKYSKYIIQDRAIPDVRDGLKPVQRRILYSMYREKNTFDKPYRKSARAVGDVMGKYHPHGDSSIYDAIVRMSQNWKMKEPFIDMQGNNGSIDGDPPAASRYTEARLSKIANEMLKDIDKNTVIMAPNYDDTILEPTVLPSKFPNLLVNGTTGISAGYATNIPPHNLIEVIDATIFRIDNPNSRLDTIMNYIKGPDFPTGAIACGIDEIRKAYETGRGRIIIKSKTKIEKNKIIISEIPYEVNKLNIVKKIDEIRIDKKIEGIVEVRDESDKDGLQITIDLKKDADANNILNYLFKNTDLQTSYNFNMITIVNRRPKLCGILDILDAYIAHQKEVIYKRSEFDLAHAKARYHIVEGLIKAISILDEVIKTIRASKNKTDAIENLIIKYEFTNEQAEAIVNLQLYRLTNTDVVVLKEEMENLKKIISGLEEILKNPDKLNSVIKEEMRRIKKEYGTDRKTVIQEDIETLKIDTSVMIPKDDVIVVITKEGYIKRVSQRSYSSSNDEDTMVKDNDYVLGIYNMNTMDTLLVFTNFGNYLYIPVYEITECKWKELGKHVSNIIPLNDNEQIIKAMPVYNFNDNIYITMFSKNGMVKRTKLEEFRVQRYSKPINMMKLKDNDELVSVCYEDKNNVFVATKNGYGLWYNTSEISVIGLKAAGVKSINLKNDEVVCGLLFDDNEEFISILTDKGTGKRLKLTEFEKGSRANRGLLLMKEIKSNPSKIVKVYITNTKKEINIITTNGVKKIKLNEMPIMDRYSNGSYVVKDKIEDVYIVEGIKSKDDIELSITTITTNNIDTNNKEKTSLKEIDDRFMTIDDLLDNMEG